MATKRYRHGLVDYNPKATTAARFRKRTAGPIRRRKLQPAR